MLQRLWIGALAGAVIISSLIFTQSSFGGKTQPGNPPPPPPPPPGSYNGPGDTVPHRGGISGYNNLCPCPSACNVEFSTNPCSPACAQVLPYDGWKCALKSCFDPTQPFPLVPYRAHSYTLRYSDWLALDQAITLNPSLLDANRNVRVCAFAPGGGAQELYFMESDLINGHSAGANSACTSNFPTVEAQAWYQPILGDPCSSILVHEGNFCFLTECLNSGSCSFAAGHLVFNVDCMRAAITWLLNNQPQSLATNPMLFNIGFLGCVTCNSNP